MSYGFGKLNEYAEEAHRTAREHGFHDDMPLPDAWAEPRHVLSWLMLISTEVAEAAEAVRKDDPDNFREELADICIRVFDTAEALGINLEQAIVDKMAKNRDRARMHGKRA